LELSNLEHLAVFPQLVEGVDEVALVDAVFSGECGLDVLDPSSDTDLRREGVGGGGGERGLQVARCSEVVCVGVGFHDVCDDEGFGGDVGEEGVGGGGGDCCGGGVEV